MTQKPSQRAWEPRGQQTKRSTTATLVAGNAITANDRGATALSHRRRCQRSRRSTGTRRVDDRTMLSLRSAPICRASAHDSALRRESAKTVLLSNQAENKSSGNSSAVALQLIGDARAAPSPAGTGSRGRGARLRDCLSRRSPRPRGDQPPGCLGGLSGQTPASTERGLATGVSLTGKHCGPSSANCLVVANIRVVHGGTARRPTLGRCAEGNPRDANPSRDHGGRHRLLPPRPSWS